MDSQPVEESDMDGYYPTELVTCQNHDTELTEDIEVNCGLQTQEVSETPLDMSQEADNGEKLNEDGTFLSSPEFQSLGVPERPWVENPTDHKDTVTKEPKMCNEETATYWTGGGADSHQQSNALTSKIVDTEQVDDINGQRENNARMYFPLEKTLRNLQLLDLKLQYNTCQAASDKKYCECSNDTSSSSDESDSNSTEPGKRNRNQDDTEQMHNLAMMTLLSECHLKLQHLEELKHYSGYLARSLWEAQKTVSFLRENITALHQENERKENEIFNLTGELLELKKLLYEKSERISEMKAMFKSLGDHLHSRSTQQTNVTGLDGDRPGHSAVEGPVAANPEMTEHGNSRICIIL